MTWVCKKYAFVHSFRNTSAAYKLQHEPVEMEATKIRLSFLKIIDFVERDLDGRLE